MIIESRFKLDHCCAPDDLRLILTYINVTQFEGVDVAVAADGYMMAIVPVKLEEGDVPGLIRADVFRQARKLSPGDLRLGLEPDAIVLTNGWRAPRILRLSDKAPPLKDYPDVTPVVDAARKSEAVSAHFGVNPRLLRAVQNAIGAGHEPIIVSRSSPSGPLLISTVRSEKPFVPPFGILMPVYSNGWSSAESKELAAATP